MKDKLLAQAFEIDIKSFQNTQKHETKVVNAFARQLCTKPANSRTKKKPAPAQPTVLIVDDNDANQKLLHTILDNFGYQCFIARDGKETMAQLNTAAVDVILMDLQLGADDGRIVAQTILNEIYSSHLAKKSAPTIIAVSAFNEMNFDRPLSDFGFKDFLQKPFSAHDLYQTVAQFVPPKPKSKD